MFFGLSFTIHFFALKLAKSAKHEPNRYQKMFDRKEKELPVWGFPSFSTVCKSLRPIPFPG
jgi:hypothetical protein